MKENENIVAYLLRVDEIVNTIRGLGETIEEFVIVQKILKTLPYRFDSKVLPIEKMRDLDKMTKDEFHGILATFKMDIEERPSKWEAAFKVSRRTKNKDSSESSSEEEEAYLAEDSRKDPPNAKVNILSCFNCGNIDHFAAKCPQVENESNEEE